MTFFKALSREPRRGGDPGKGLQRPPPPPRKPIFPHPYHQSVQFSVQFFSKKIVLLLSKNFFLLSLTSNLLSFTTFYSVLPRLVLSFTKYPPWELLAGCIFLSQLVSCQARTRLLFTFSRRQAALNRLNGGLSASDSRSSDVGRHSATSSLRVTSVVALYDLSLFVSPAAKQQWPLVGPVDRFLTLSVHPRIPHSVCIRHFKAILCCIINVYTRTTLIPPQRCGQWPSVCHFHAALCLVSGENPSPSPPLPSAT